MSSGGVVGERNGVGWRMVERSVKTIIPLGVVFDLKRPSRRMGSLIRMLDDDEEELRISKGDGRSVREVYVCAGIVCTLFGVYLGYVYCTIYFY